MLELLLILIVALIMFASLALTKMDCNRIANYFMLPVLLGLAYFNIAHYRLYRHNEPDDRKPDIPAGETGVGTINAYNSTKVYSGDNNPSTVDIIELTLTNVLGLMTIVQLAANSFRSKLSGILL